MLSEAIDRVEAGLTDGIVVAKLDRFGRSLLDSLAAIERIQLAGGTFVAVQDGLDMSTDTGKLVLRIMLSMAEWELDRIRGQWNSARKRAVARGIHMGRCAPTGYQRRSDRRLAPDPRVAPAIATIFRLRADGAGFSELARYLTEKEIPAEGKYWQARWVKSIVANRVYLGELRSGQYVNRNAYEPIVDHTLWEAAQRPRATNSKSKERKPTLLGGLLRCAGCLLTMSSQTIVNAQGTPERVYTCKSESSAGHCDSRASISGRIVEPYIDAMFFDLLHAEDSRMDTQASFSKLSVELDAACADTARYRDSTTIFAALGEERFAKGLEKRVDRERHLRLTIDTERALLGARRGMSAEEWETGWPSMSVIERRQTMSEVIDCVFIVRGRGRADARILACGRGDAPPDLPSRGGPGIRTIKPFDPAAHRLIVPADARGTPGWSKTRIKKELLQFLDTQKTDEWPSDDEFVQAGRGPLLRQIDLAGGASRRTREPRIDAKSQT